MAKSARASRIKTNNQKLKKRVFGPVEQARNERLSEKLLALASQPKPLRTEMEVETSKAEPQASNDGEEDANMNVDGAELTKTTTRTTGRSNTAVKKAKENKLAKIEKKRHRKTTNRIAFPKHPKKTGGNK